MNRIVCAVARVAALMLTVLLVVGVTWGTSFGFVPTASAVEISESDTAEESSVTLGYDESEVQEEKDSPNSVNVGGTSSDTVQAEEGLIKETIDSDGAAAYQSQEASLGDANIVTWSGLSVELTVRLFSVNGQPIEGAGFCLGDHLGVCYDSAITDEEGVAILEVPYYSDVGSGEGLLYQTSVPAGYKQFTEPQWMWFDDPGYTGELVAEWTWGWVFDYLGVAYNETDPVQTGNLAAELIIYQEPLTSDVQVELAARDPSGEAIPDAEVCATLDLDEVSASLLPLLPDAYWDEQTNSSVPVCVTADSAGNAVFAFDALPLGGYAFVLEEQASPDRYTAAQQATLRFTVGADEDDAAVLVAADFRLTSTDGAWSLDAEQPLVTLVNELNIANLYLTLLDSNNRSKALGGAEFCLVDVGGSNRPDLEPESGCITTDANGQLTLTWRGVTSQSDSYAFDLVQTSASASYTSAGALMTITPRWSAQDNLPYYELTSFGSMSAIDSFSLDTSNNLLLTVLNDFSPVTDVRITLVDKDVETLKLAGGQFRATIDPGSSSAPPEGFSEVTSTVTGDDGVAVFSFDGLTAGGDYCYRLSQIRVPDDYEAPDDPADDVFCINVDGGVPRVSYVYAQYPWSFDEETPDGMMAAFTVVNTMPRYVLPATGGSSRRLWIAGMVIASVSAIGVSVLCFEWRRRQCRPFAY